MGIGSVTLNDISHYGKKALRLYPDLVLGTGAETVTQTLKDSFYGVKKGAGKRTGGKYFKDFWTQLKDAFKAGERHNETLIKEHGGFWKSTKEAIKTTPEVIRKAVKEGSKQAAKAGKNQFWGGTKGFFKGLGKRLPLIGTALIVLTEIPNIIKATANEGIVSGMAEVVKAGARLGGGMVLGTIAAALLGPLGAPVGYIIGDLITRKIVGKSYSERTAEAKNANNVNNNNTSNVNNTSFNMFDPSIYNPTMTKEQLMQIQNALAGGYGLNLNTYV